MSGYLWFTVPFLMSEWSNVDHCCWLACWLIKHALLINCNTHAHYSKEPHCTLRYLGHFALQKLKTDLSALVQCTTKHLSGTIQYWYNYVGTGNFHFSFLKWVKEKLNSLFNSRKEWNHLRFHYFSREKRVKLCMKFCILSWKIYSFDKSKSLLNENHVHQNFKISWFFRISWEFWTNFTSRSRSRGNFISLFILDLDIAAF